MSDNTVMYPFFRYQDAPAAIDWLCRVFGFMQLMSVPGDNGTIVHAQLSLGPAIIMVGSGSDWSGDERPNDILLVKQGVYVSVDDADAHYETAKTAGAQIVRGPEDTDYGSREYSAYDPGGYYWSFGTYRPVAD